MSENGWRVYASRKNIIYTSPSLVDSVASEECRSWVVDKFSENPVVQANLAIAREDPKKTGRWNVALFIPAMWTDVIYDSEQAAREFIAKTPAMRLPIAVAVGSEEEVRLVELARRLIHDRRG